MPQAPALKNTQPHRHMATTLVSSDEHLVQFYENEEFLADVVVTFIGAGLASGEPALIVATAEHRRAFLARLEATGFDVEGACTSGLLMLLDARTTLATFMIDGAVDQERFRRAIGGLVEERVRHAGRSPLRAYGEMVDLLWQEGNTEAAIALEEMWNELQRLHRFKLLCAYGIESFYQKASGLHEICKAHGSVLVLPADNVGSRSYGDRRGQSGSSGESAGGAQALRSSFGELRRAEEELRGRQRELHDLAENAPLGLHRIGVDGTILWANRAELDLVGCREDEYVGRNIADFHADATLAREFLARLGRGETVADFQATLRARDGSLRQVSISSNVQWDNGRFEHARSFTRDVSEAARDERAREATIKRSERLTKITAAIADAITRDQVFEALVDQVGLAVEASSGALWMIDESERAVKLARAFGLTEESKRRLEQTQFDAPDSFPGLDAIRRGEPIWIGSQEELLMRYPHLASAVSAGRSYRIAALPLVNQGRHLGALTFTFDDAPPLGDEQRSFLMLVARYSGQALERLRLVEENQYARARAELLYRLLGGVVEAHTLDDVFSAALEAIAGALGAERASILVFDAQGTMRFRAWRGLSDDYRRAVEGHSPWAPDARAPELIIVSDVENDASVASYRPLFRAEKIGALAFIPLVAGGRLVGKFMVYYGEPRGLSPHEVDLAQAIANHVAAALTKFSAMQELEETVRFNEMFTAILGHDLRNPLGAIMATADVAMRKQENERIIKPLGRILFSGQRMARMIDQLLDFTRSRLGKGLVLRPKAIDVLPLLRQVLDELAVAHPTWVFRLDHTGDTTGSWDDDRLCQVFSNLIGNAVQHGVAESGVDTYVDGTSPAGIAVHVHNMGAVPRELIPRLFDPMTGGETRREKSNGLGLGLFITQQIARAHGGRVDVVSSEEKGTTFTVLLPRPDRMSEKGNAR